MIVLVKWWMIFFMVGDCFFVKELFRKNINLICRYVLEKDFD